MESRFVNFGVETTNICNASCSFCAYRFLERPKTVMAWEMFEKAVLEFSAAGGGTLNFTPTVGEPLADKQILDKIRFAAKQKNITSIFLYTNAILIDRFGFDEILNSGLTRLAISTYIGTREGYLRYYGKDKYDQVMSNIEGIVRRNYELGRPVTITLHLRSSPEEREWQQNPIYKRIDSYLGEENIDFLTSYDSWSGRISQEDLPPGSGLEQPLPVEVKQKSACFELYRRVHILADGQVGACVCSDLEAEINLGDLNTQTLQEIWDGPRLAQYRKDWQLGHLPQPCINCTRYMGLDEYIKNNRYNLLMSYLRRIFSARKT